MRVREMICAAGLVAFGCQPASSEATETPSGRGGFEVTCVKTSDDGYCDEEASKRCPSGYVTENKDEFWRQNAGVNTGGQLMLRWVIACK
jgi:hypothetical protein